MFVTRILIRNCHQKAAKEIEPKYFAIFHGTPHPTAKKNLKTMAFHPCETLKNARY